MESPDSPNTADIEELARIRSALTRLVAQRLEHGLTGEEEAEYRRLTEAERLLLHTASPPPRRSDDPRPTGS